MEEHGVGNRFDTLENRRLKALSEQFAKIGWDKQLHHLTADDAVAIIDAIQSVNESKIGKHCFIGPNSCLEHNNSFNNFSSCGAGVTCGGNVNVGKFSFLGIGVSVKHKINIKDNWIIGGQSLVLKDCEKNSMYFGVPAKKKKKWK